jgi:predicted AlkP superfamily pyrophosphatase or phosphodiesterase
LPEFFSTIESVVKQTMARSFTYAYWPEFDHLSHLNGVHSEAVEQHRAELDAGIDGLLHEISGTDTVLVVTADHGFVDIPSDRIVAA